ncbi:MAG: type II toxin-antitoxin system death-on-curing family toxin [Calditrichaeota bacterium]|nr:type II toxin-antitoxin system death-on-curing family toxin [Calditrichota bacterium]
MNEPLWLEQTDILVIHQKMIGKYGGASGVRDEGLLDSALASPQNQFAYGETDFFMLAATYVRGIALNHPFIDGNKRTAFTAGLVFLDINGVWVSANPQEAVDQVVGLIERRETVESFAQWLRDNSK